DERAAVHIEECGLLPPSTDVRQVLDVLDRHLGGQVWSGWTWIEANVPRQGARDAIRKAPSLAQGIVVRPTDLERAGELLRAAGVDPQGPVLLTDTDALHRSPELPGTVLGPKESAWFDREAAQMRLRELQQRLDRHREGLRAAEARHRDLERTRESFRAFRE